MRTSGFVVGMTGAGILGGAVGAFLCLTAFAGGSGPGGAPATAPPAPAEPPFSPEEAEALRRLPKRLQELEAALAALGSGPAARPPAGRGPAPAGGPADPAEVGSAAARESTRNEKAAMATLRNLATCQAMIQTTGKIDADVDGIGEFGTLQEMAGVVGVRKGSDGRRPAAGSFAEMGTPVQPPILSAALANVDSSGRATKTGYVFQVFLPDAGSPAGFVHETRGPGLAGGTATVGIDFSETTWCAYAWPLEKGRTGNRAFFVNQSGDVLQSDNENGKHYGLEHAMDPASAFLGPGITSRIAVGTRGGDGDVWKVTN